MLHCHSVKKKGLNSELGITGKEQGTAEAAKPEVNT
jgi:hypothetical protein